MFAIGGVLKRFEIAIYCAAVIAAMFALLSCGGPSGGRTDSGAAKAFTAGTASGGGTGNFIGPMQGSPTSPGMLSEDAITGILTREFEAKLAEAREGKLASAAPSYSPGQVFDLYYDVDTETLHWTYFNPGDYDLDGEVGIPDITPLALNFAKTMTGGEWDDPYLAWLDGSENGEIGVTDVWPIAINFEKRVDGYEIFSAGAADGEYELLGNVEFTASPGGFPRAYSFKLPKQGKQYVKVRPYFAGDTGNDSAPILLEAFYFPPAPPASITATQGTFNNRIRIEWEPSEGAVGYFVFDGETGDNISMVYGFTFYNDYSIGDDNPRSYFVKAFNDLGQGPESEIATGWASGLPVINSVIFGEIYKYADAAFSASLTGLGTFDYSWYFGDLAEPAQSSQVEPVVKFNTAGYVDCSLSVSNEYGSAYFPFQVSVYPVEEPPAQPEIISVSQVDEVENEFARFSADVTGDEPLTYSWNFGDGADPPTTSQKNPTVKLQNPGLHSGSLTVSNAGGSDQIDFEYNVQLYWQLPAYYVQSAPNFVNANASQAQSVYNITGTTPIDFEWDFGGGATPNIVQGVSTSVVFTGEGEYTLTIKGTNAVGTTERTFTYFVAGTNFSTSQIADFSTSSVRLYNRGGNDLAAIFAASGSASNAVYTRHFDGSAWVSTYGGYISSSYATHFIRNITFDSANNPRFVNPYTNMSLYESPGAGFERDVNLIPYFGYYASLALDGADNPLIAYTRTDVDGLFLAKRAAGNWTYELLADNPSEAENSPIIKCDSNGNVHVIYNTSGQSTDGDIKYCFFDGNSWLFEDIGPVSGTIFSDLQITNSDEPAAYYIRYDGSVGQDLYVARRNGGNWSHILIDSGVRAIDLATAPYLIAAQDGSLRLFYRKTGMYVYSISDTLGNVVSENFPASITGSSISYNMQLDSLDNPHLLFQSRVGDSGGTGCIFYTYNTGGGWIKHPIDFTNGPAHLLLDGDEKAAIVYVKSSETRLARFTG